MMTTTSATFPRKQPSNVCNAIYFNAHSTSQVLRTLLEAEIGDYMLTGRPGIGS
jgi:hypothetical protein